MAYSRYRNLIEMLARRIPDYSENRKDYNPIFQQLIDMYERETERHFTTESGKYINAAFVHSGLTWKIVSKKTGINVSTLHKFCLGSQTPNNAQIDVLAQVLRFDAQFLKNMVLNEKLDKGDIATWRTGHYITPKYKNNRNWKDKI